VASDWPNDSDSVLRGLWGNMVSAREQGGGGAANMWQSIQSGATAWAEGVLNITSPTPPTQEEIAATAKGLIGNITIQDVNRYTKLAGEYLAAKSNLSAQGLEEQVLGTSIFTPPWATTTDNPAVPDRFRIRVLRDITVRGFTLINRQEWATYEISGALTSAGNALDQANQLFTQADYNARASINSVLDYSIEQV
jgi:hypothetical protein